MQTLILVQKGSQPTQKTIDSRQESTPLFSRASSQSQPIIDAGPVNRTHSGDGTDETLHTGPSHDREDERGKDVDESATESDEESESPPPTKKRRVIGGVGHPSPGGTPRNKGKGTSDSSGSDAPVVTSARKGAGVTRVKQPVTRGGRRL